MLVLTVVALLLMPLSASIQPAKAQAASSGIVCTTSPTATFTLNTADGYINLPDGNLVYMWGYADATPGALAFQYPSPTLCVNEGDTVTITLNNTLAVATSIMFPGQNNVLANGLPAQPEFDVSNVMTSLTNSVAPGGSITYSFVADHPGTFIYESGTDAELQQQMGMVGALIVHPNQTGAFASGYAYNWAGSQYTPAEEFMLMISEIDPDIHLAVELGEPYSMTTYHPRYWLLNGRAFPDTILPNGTPWLPSQPYSALPHIEVMSATHTQPALIRYLNVGRYAHPWHPHGENGRVIGRDGYPLVSPAGEDLSYEEYLFDIGPSQTVDVTWKFTDVEQWNGDVNSPGYNPAPGFDYQKQNLIRGELFASPYLGAHDGGLTGEVNFNQCGEFYHIWHTHAVFEVAAYGIPMGGMVTVVRIDPTNGCP
jgi:FtsP/CotA-like multicopper oxidase with cupredoxin domain